MTWSRRCGGSIPATQRSTGPTDHVQLVPARERFDDGGPLVSIIDFMAAAPGGVHWLVSEIDHVRQQAMKLREQLENSYQEAQTRGHVVALPPAEAFVDWETLAARAWRSATPGGAGESTRAVCTRSPVSPRWNSAVGSAIGLPISGERGSAAPL